MPNKKPTSSNGEDFVAQVVKDPADPPRIQLLSGFPGASSEEGHSRLYSDARLSQWVDVPDGSILHRQEIPAASSPLGGSYLWVEQDAELIYGRAGGPASEGSFLGASPAEQPTPAAAQAPPHFLTFQQCSVYPGPGGPSELPPPGPPHFLTFQQCSVYPGPGGPWAAAYPPQPPPQGPPQPPPQGPPQPAPHFYVTFQQCSVPSQSPAPPNYLTFQQCSVPPYWPYGG